MGIWTILLTSFIIASLYLARPILIPIGLAALLTFLLAPVVTFLQRWLGRVGAVLLAVSFLLAAAAGTGWMLTAQLVDLAGKLPDYQKNIEAKLQSFKLPVGGRFTRFSQAVEQIKKELPGAKSPETNPNTQTAAESGAVTKAIDQPAVPPAVPVQVVDRSSNNPIHLLRAIIGPLLGPLGTAALVLILVIFMLLKREDLRSRVIRLIGQGNISATTRAMDDAGARVTRYLLMQFLVNLSYGVIVTIGLLSIGVPNALLWGAFAGILRFIPYVGPWIGAAFPVGLAIAIFPGWTMPVLTLGFFIALELLCANVLEPWLYGSRTGVTPVALILAALFWTWLWGPVGLVLATPMTVCLVVMGRHIPRLAFLGILLSDEQVLTPAEDCYHRLLTVGDQDEIAFIEAFLKANSLTALYDSVFVPIITTLETDYRTDRLDDEQRAMINQSLRDIIQDLGAHPRRRSEVEKDPADGVEETLHTAPPLPAQRVYCLPARADRDELAGTMLVQLLRAQGCEAFSTRTGLEADDLISLVQKAAVNLVCISVVAPSTVLHARYLCLKLRAVLPAQKILVGLWGSTENVTDAARRLRDSGADIIATTFAEAMLQLNLVKPSPVSPAILSADLLSPA